MEGEELAVYRPRKAGERRVVALDNGAPPLKVVFVVPDPLATAEYEAAAQQAMEIFRQAPGTLARYGLQREGVLTDTTVQAAARIVVAIEAAILLWKDWNLASPGPDGEPVKRLLSPNEIATLLGDPQLRAAWMLHLDAASPMERLEGNASAASPDTTSDGAATTAGDAGPSDGPAPGASAEARESSALG